MSGVNKAIILGNVGNDPEVKYMPNGNAVANLSIATSETWKDKSTSDKQEKTEWHRIVAFGKLAEIIEKYVKKGSKLYIEGKLQTRSWEQDGQKRYATEVVVSEMQFVDSRSETGNTQSQKPQQSQPAQGSSFDNFDEDIPF